MPKIPLPPLLFLVLPGLSLLFPIPHFSQPPNTPATFLSFLTPGEPTSYDQFFFQDSHGFIWGTRDNHSIIRYDGHGYEIFAPDETDSTAFAGCPLYADWLEFLEDRTGKIWIRTMSGCLDRYDPQTDRFGHMIPVLMEQFPKTRGSGRFSDILEDRQGNIWIASETWGLVRYHSDKNKFEVFPMSGFPSLIFEDVNGRIWAFLDKGNNDQSLYRLDAQTGRLEGCVPVPALSGPSNKENRNLRNTAVRMGNTSSFLLGINHQLYRFDASGEVLSLFETDLGKGEYLSSLYANESSVWIGTNQGRIFQYDASLQERQLVHDPVEETSTHSYSRIIGQLFLARDGVLWFSYGGNIRYLPPNRSSFRRMALPDGISGVRQRIFQGGALFPFQGKVWFNTYPYPRPVRPDVGRTLPVQVRWTGLENDTTVVYQFAQDSAGGLWVVATEERSDTSARIHIRFLDPEGKERWAFSSAQPHRRHQPGDPFFRKLKTDPLGGLWLSSGYEIWRVEPGGNALLPIALDSTLRGRYFWDFLADRSGNLWVDDDKRDGQTGLWTPNPALAGEKKKASKNVRSFFEASDGQIWFGTYAGAVRLDLRTSDFQHYKDHLPPSSPLVLNFFEDREKAPWRINANGTLSRYHAPTDRFIHFSWIDGFEISDFPTELWTDSAGYVYFRTTKQDINYFHPDGFQVDTTFPGIHFTGLELFNAFVRPGDTTGLLHENLDFTGSIRLKYAQNDFAIHYTAPEYIHNEEMVFAIQLEGFHDDWQEVGAKREARFTNLSPGRYTFKVKVRNHHGFWSESPRTLQIRVLPPWYRTPWAYALWVALTLGTIYAIYRYQLRRRLALAEAERLKELDQAKTQLYTNITHEFRTPITIILGMADQMKNDPKSWYNEGLRLIRRNGKQLLNLVNQMLDLSKLESGHMPLNLENGDIISYLQYLTESFDSYADSKDIRLHFLCDIQELAMDYDPEKMQNILSNLLSNAIKFTPAGGDVYVQLAVGSGQSTVGSTIKLPAANWKLPPEDYLLLTVRDNGLGIAPEHLPHIFNRFYQADATSTRRGEGTGIGLALTQELVRLMGGRIEVESQLKAGTKFSIWLPISQSAPKASLTSQEASVSETLLLEKNPQAPAPETVRSDLPLVLLIEDNLDVITYLSAFLSGEYQIETATNGQEGIDKALDLIPDLVVSDVMMPEKDGFEVCATLKTDERTSHIPVILLTAKSDDASRLEGLTYGADAYLAKPFNQEELLVRMEKLIELRRRLQARYQKAGELVHLEEKTNHTPEDRFLQKLVQIVEENLADEHFGLPGLCKKAGLSRSQLFRKLKALTGQSTTHFIRSIRLAKGKEMLETTDMTVSEVAYAVGFNRVAYFSTMFREEFGVSPSEVRG